MLGEDEIADVEGHARAFLQSHGLADLDGPTPMEELTLRATGKPPAWDPTLATEAAYDAENDEVLLRPGLARARARWLIGHELSEREMLLEGYCRGDIERRADAMGAAIAVPRAAFIAAVRSGAKVYALADRFKTTQSLALLRIGETTRRPVALLRHGGTIARGAPWRWDSMSRLVRGARREEVHPVTIRDEPGKVGLMVDVRTWLSDA